MIPRPATRRTSHRRARVMGAMAARARGAFLFPARPALPQGVATIPQQPAGRGILFAALAWSALDVHQPVKNWTHPGGAAFSSDPATAQRETVAPASRRPAAWQGPFHCPVVATAGSVPAEQPKDEATRRIDGAVQVSTDTRSAARPTGRRIVAGETPRGGGGECQAHPAEAPAGVSLRSTWDSFGDGASGAGQRAAPMAARKDGRLFETTEHTERTE